MFDASLSIQHTYVQLGIVSTIKDKKNPNGYIVPAKFGVHFLLLMKNVPKRTNLHLNEIGLTNTEFCKSQSQLRRLPISWKIRYFSTFINTGVRLNVTAMLCILCKYACTILKAKSNFTLFFFEYIYTRSDFKQMEHCH